VSVADEREAVSQLEVANSDRVALELASRDDTG
jgi:hypothetical protein